GLNYEDYAIQRDRTAIGGKIEFQLNQNHRFYFAASYNRYHDTEDLQELEVNASTGSSVSYRGSLYFNTDVAKALGYDLNDAAVKARLALPSANSSKKLTYDEANQLGEIVFNEDTKNYDKFIAAGDTKRRFQQIRTDDRIDTYQFGGIHKLFDGLSLDYKLYTSEADKIWTSHGVALDSPEFSFVIELDPAESYLPSMAVNNSLGQINDPSLFVLTDGRGQIYSNEYSSTDKRRGFETNADYSFDFFGLAMITSAGVAGDFRDKSYWRNYGRYSDIEMEGKDVLTLASDYFGGDLTSSFLGSSGKTYEFGPRFDADKTLSFLLNTPEAVTLIQYPDDITYNMTDAVLKNYDAEEDITAAYLMQKASIGRWTLIGGFRYEHTKNGFGNNIVITTLNGTFISPTYWKSLEQNQYCQYAQSERSYDDILPAVHLRRELWKDMILRLSATKGISRPTFTDLVPFEIVSISGAKFGRSIRLPNMDLEAMRTNNYDVSLEQYLKGIGLVSVDFFYKQLTGAIYEATRSNVAAADNPEINYYSHKYIASSVQANAATWTTSRMENT
ncbi:MAG TPA: outer membrane beta-barrel protein, partial [Opitutales bacterium]|nr:outer membrane beta-barrel protein [Opitutales bacterium]